MEFMGSLERYLLQKVNLTLNSAGDGLERYLLQKVNLTLNSAGDGLFGGKSRGLFSSAQLHKHLSVTICVFCK